MQKRKLPCVMVEVAFLIPPTADKTAIKFEFFLEVYFFFSFFFL